MPIVACIHDTQTQSALRPIEPYISKICHLVDTVEFVIHEPRDDAGLPHRLVPKKDLPRSGSNRGKRSGREKCIPNCAARTSLYLASGAPVFAAMLA